MNPHLSFEGTLKYEGSLTIDCDFRGEVTTDDTLVVGPSGVVRADLSGGVVEISGKVHGDVKGQTSVKIYRGGEVYGNIETPTISMDHGVVFEGTCSRPAAQRQPAKTVSTPAAVQTPRGSGVPAAPQPLSTGTPSAQATPSPSKHQASIVTEPLKRVGTV